MKLSIAGLLTIGLVMTAVSSASSFAQTGAEYVGTTAVANGLAKKLGQKLSGSTDQSLSTLNDSLSAQFDAPAPNAPTRNPSATTHP